MERRSSLFVCGAEAARLRAAAGPPPPHRARKASTPWAGSASRKPTPSRRGEDCVMGKLTLKSLESKLREIAMAYPDTYEDHPWGESAIKIRPQGKAFLFMRAHDDEISFSVKLPNSRDMAADLPWAEPTHYGMGKYGW